MSQWTDQYDLFTMAVEPGLAHSLLWVFWRALKHNLWKTTFFLYNRNPVLIALSRWRVVFRTAFGSAWFCLPACHILLGISRANLGATMLTDLAIFSTTYFSHFLLFSSSLLLFLQMKRSVVLVAIAAVALLGVLQPANA